MMVTVFMAAASMMMVMAVFMAAATMMMAVFVTTATMMMMAVFMAATAVVMAVLLVVAVVASVAACRNLATGQSQRLAQTFIDGDHGRSGLGDSGCQLGVLGNSLPFAVFFSVALVVLNPVLQNDGNFFVCFHACPLVVADNG
ncbi:MAG: hypothetical protein LBU39_00225 [Desulfobulbaceae bacterium]|jgi:small-conductance mechanosensitive channel|nr:hypothetical protein [Desulfobulbaceae bacterium]